MASISSEIAQWVEKQPYWEQAAFEKIFAGIQCTDADCNELLQFLLQEAGLSPLAGQFPELNYKTAILPQSSHGQTKILKIANMCNVNALVPGQELYFGPALTAIFGANASGKSGYSRVLGCAGFTRGDQQVLPDITRPTDDPPVISADIEIFDGIVNKMVQYEVGKPCPELTQFYVFDSTSVSRQLNRSNEFSFSPASLFYLTQLANLTDRVRSQLKTKIEQCNQKHNFSPLFLEESPVAELIANLGPSTNIESLEQLATLSPEEKRQAQELVRQIAELTVRDVNAQITNLQQSAKDLTKLAEILRQIEDKLNSDAMKDIIRIINHYNEMDKIVRLQGIDQFKSEHFSKTGSKEWYQFVEAAKLLAEAERYGDKPYPQPDAHCLLCQQTLTEESCNLLFRLWEFLKGEAQTRLNEAHSYLEEKQAALQSLDLEFFNTQSVYYRHLQTHNPPLLKQIIDFAISSKCLREVFVT